MKSNEHLELLLEERRALLRRVARLEAVISVERLHSQDMASRMTNSTAQRDELSWEDALHEAKVPLSSEAFLPG